MYIHLRWIWDGLENRKITSAASCFLSGFRPARQNSFQEKLALWGNRSPRSSVTEACSISKRGAKTGHKSERRINSDSSIVSAGLHFRSRPGRGLLSRFATGCEHRVANGNTGGRHSTGCLDVRQLARSWSNVSSQLQRYARKSVP